MTAHLGLGSGSLARTSVSHHSSLLQLQSVARADPEGYDVEIRQQFAHFEACCRILSASPLHPPPELKHLASFLAHVIPALSKCNKNRKTQDDVATRCPLLMLSVLEDNASHMEVETRRSLAKSVAQLHARGFLNSSDVIPLFFSLFRCKDFTLRSFAFQHVVSSLSSTKRGKNGGGSGGGNIGGALSGFLYRMVLDENEVAAKKSMAVVMQLFRNGSWRDGKCVAVIASAANHTSGKVLRAACNFFLGQDDADQDDTDSDADDDDNNEYDESNFPESLSVISREDVYKAQKKGTIRTKKRKQEKLKLIAKAARKAARKDKCSEPQGFTAIQLIPDPQGFAEKLLSRLNKGSESYEIRLTLMRLISRLVGVHRLLLLNFYPLLQRYIQPHQRNVTTVLASLVQAIHEEVPPDVLEPVLKQLLDSFISDKSRPEVRTVGLKTLREMANRCPLLLGEDLLSDLVEYKKDKDKGVSAAARGLIQLYRDIAPHLLHKRERGKGADMSAKLTQYGHKEIAKRVDGVELLEQDIKCTSLDDDSDEGMTDEEISDSYLIEESEEDGTIEGENGKHEQSIGLLKKENTKTGDGEGDESLRSLRRSAKQIFSSKDPIEDPTLPIEQSRFLTNEDFAEIKRLKSESDVQVNPFGQGSRKYSASEKRMRAENLEAHKARGHDKESRLATVIKGREDRGDFGSAADRKKKKTGGLSNKEKAKKKVLPKGVLNKKARSRAKHKKGIGSTKKMKSKF